MLNELALFHGAGGGLLGSRLLGWRTVCGVEIDPYAREIVLRRQEEGFLDAFPIWDDAFTFDGLPWRNLIDVISAGFPCQPFSAAGRGLGEHDPRNMWPQTKRIIREVGPAFCFLENVPGLLTKKCKGYFGRVLGELSEAGFDAIWDVVPAKQVGANHLRERIWVLAYANSERLSNLSHSPQAWQPDAIGCGANGADTLSIRRNSRGNNHRTHVGAVASAVRTNDGTNSQGKGLSHRRQIQRKQAPVPQGWIDNQSRSKRPDRSWWAVEPNVGRVGDGVAFRVDRIKSIGNGQVPAVVVEAWNQLLYQARCELAP